LVALAGGCGKSDSKSDGQSAYVVMPYVLGDLSQIKGATADKFTITVNPDAKSGAGFLDVAPDVHGGQGFAEPGVERVMSASTYDHQRRSLLNRFDPSKGMDQGAWFWHTTRELDQQGAIQAGRPGFASFATDGARPAITDFYARMAQTPPHKRVAPYRLAADASICPTDIIAPDHETPSDTDTLVVPASGLVAGADYCIAYVDDPVTADKATIQAAIEEILKVYKTVIYQDTFPDTADGYSFKPVIVVVNFADQNKWPQADAYQVSGAFIKAMSTAGKRPMLYMAADFQKLPRNKTATDYDKALNTKLWYSTMAHEMQHAIMNYYRGHAHAGVDETPAIDEGLAHYMEDVFGCGQENFGGYAKAFLDVWVNGLPFLHATDSDDITRGGAESFLYYLTSRKGGLAFTDGVVSGGGGLDFIRKVVTNTQENGPKNLADSFGGDWTETVGDYLGALALDGTAATTILDKYKVQEPVTTVTDLAGNKNKTFGMHFNGFGGLPATRTWETKFESTKTLDDMVYYATTPVLYGSDPGDVTYQTSLEGATVAITKVQVN